MYAHLEQPPPRVTDHRPDLPSSVDDVIAAALAKGTELRESLVQGTAAGAANFLRHGLGTGSQATIAELETSVRIRPVDQNGGSTEPPETMAEGPSRAIQPR